MNGVPTLMYHSIGGSDRLAVRPDVFAENLAYLREHRFTPISLTVLARWVDERARGRAEIRLPDRPVLITFDDGYGDAHEHALPILSRYGFPAAVFVTTGWLRGPGTRAVNRPPGRMLTWTQVRELAEHGIEIGAHSHSHAQLDQLSDADLRDELSRSRGLLEDRLGRSVTTMAYPYGYSSARVRRAVRAAGYAAACAVANRTVDVDADILALPRLTVRASTSRAAFARALDGRGFLADRALTKGYALVRRSRYAATAAARHVARPASGSPSGSRSGSRSGSGTRSTGGSPGRAAGRRWWRTG
jgi:peptidoglycan/xylan/chitin deacetylase (PgdA/CDA1 family)